MVLNDVQAFAHTSPVYVHLGQQPILVASDARYWVTWIETLIDRTSKKAKFATPERLPDADEIIVAISDQGGEASGTPKPAEEPDLLKKLDGGQSPRGWGLFLIRNMVDAMDITTNGQRHTIWLTMRTGGAAHGEHV